MKNSFRLGIAVLAILFLFLTLPACTRRQTYTATYLDTFDTVLTVTVAATSHKEATVHTTAIHNILLNLHKQLDVYKKHEGVTGLYDLNCAEGVSITVSREIMDILLLGQSFYTRTDGRLNICIGALTSLWHDAQAAGDRLPDPNALAEAMKHISLDVLILDENALTACISDPATRVDVGAFAKGYALSRIKAYADEQGLDSLLVNLGGQVLAIGSRPNGAAWEISVRNPIGKDETVYVHDAVVAACGDDQRAYTVDGKVYHHIIDPETGYPTDTYRTVTVILPLSQLAESDAYSTALFLLSREEGEALIDEIPAAAVMWVTADGTVIKSENWRIYT